MKTKKQGTACRVKQIGVLVSAKEYRELRWLAKQLRTDHLGPMLRQLARDAVMIERAKGGAAS